MQTVYTSSCKRNLLSISSGPPLSGRFALRRDLQEECLAQQAQLAYRRHHVARLHQDHSAAEAAWQQQRAALQKQLAGLQLEVATAQAQLAGSYQGAPSVSLQVKWHQGVSLLPIVAQDCLSVLSA